MTSRSQARLATSAQSLTQGAQEAPEGEENYTSVATIEPPAQEQSLEDDDSAITWNDAWATPEAEPAASRSWRWHEPSFDDDTSETLMALPRRTLRERLMQSLPFGLRERAWSGLAAWRRHVGILITFGVICLIAVAGGIIGYQQIVKATENSDLSLAPQNSNPTAPSGVVIMPPAVESTTPTPANSAYEIGTWVSNSAPTGGTVTVFVRIVQNMQGAGGIPVTVSVQSPGSSKNYGPSKTDGSGIVKFTVHYGAASGTDPVFVTATAHVNGQTLSAQTTFVPSSGSTQPSGTPTPASGASQPTPGGHRHR